MSAGLCADMKKIILLLVIGYLLLAAMVANAQISPDLQSEIRNLGQQAALTGLGERAASDIDVRVYVLRIVRGLLGFAGLILVLMILYGGTLYLTSQGMEEKTEKGKQIITRAVIGAAIIVSSYGVTVWISRQLIKAIFTQMITQAQGCGTTNGEAICCHEWNAYQTELANVPSILQGASGIAQQDRENRARSREAYNRWRACFERETERAGLDSNLFD